MDFRNVQPSVNVEDHTADWQILIDQIKKKYPIRGQFMAPNLAMEELRRQAAQLKQFQDMKKFNEILTKNPSPILQSKPIIFDPGILGRAGTLR